MDVSGVEYSQIRTVQGTAIKKVKGKISVHVQDKSIVSIDIILGQNFLEYFDEINIDNRQLILTMNHDDIRVECTLLTKNNWNIVNNIK